MFRGKKSILSKLLVCVLVVATLVGTAFAYSEVREAFVVDYKIKLNNTEVKLAEKPVIINDRTYLPVRTICEDALGMIVDWNQAEQTVEMWNITKPSDRGTHEYPVKVGTPVSGEFKSKDKTNVTYSISVMDIQRGASVETELRNYWKQENPYNAPERPEVKSSDKNYDTKMENYRKSVAKAEEAYADKINKYIGKMLQFNDGAVTGLSKDVSLTSRGDYEFVKAKVHIDIKPSASSFEYKTAVNDFIPYCGTVNVDGLNRQYVEYKQIAPIVVAEHAYAGKQILTNGITEGYMYFAVYKADATPRVMYKDGQYLGLYK